MNTKNIVKLIKIRLRKIKLLAYLYSLYRIVLKKINKYYSTKPSYFKKYYKSVINKKIETPLSLNLSELKVGAIEVNKNCNLNCLMCNTGLSKRPNMNMPLDLFERCMKLLKKYNQLRGIPIHTIGEPLINPFLEDYFKILRKHEIKILLSTNGQKLDKKLDLICDYKDVIDSFRFSIDGATKETYEKIRIPGKFEKLIANLDLFNKRNAYGKFFKNVRIDSIISKDTVNEIAYHYKFYSKYAKMSNIVMHLINGLSLDNSYFFNNSLIKKQIVRHRPCASLFSPSISVLCDGRVTACGRDYNGDLVFGNILESTPEELINNDKIMQLRKYHINGNIPKDSLCYDCYDINPKINAIFHHFSKVLVVKNGKNWDVDKMQNKFNKFFELSASGIPSQEDVLSLLYTK